MSANVLAPRCQRPPPEGAAPIFTAPFDRLDDARLLDHFRSRRGVHYFPVADPEETGAGKIAAIMNGRFEFVGETFDLGEPIDWLHNPSRDVEWHILLHKFYYAVGLGMACAASGDQAYADRWASLIDSWIARTPVGFIAADVTGRRVQNWIYSYYHFVSHGDAAIDPAFHRRCLESVHAQVEFLLAHLSPARNHRTLELVAIFLAGVVFPEMRGAGAWRDFALGAMAANIREDHLADGVQCELSTDYHHLVLKNTLNVRRLASLNGIAVPADIDAGLVRALEFSLHAHKPDGIVPSLSDGDARGFLDLLREGARLFDRPDMLYVASGGSEGTPPRQRSRVFADSGYVILRSDWGECGRAYADAQYMILDCGPLGAGNHGHFDCLSFELAANGRSLVVDPGRYTYSEAGATNWRVHFRGTAAHNTVCVDGQNQTAYLAKAIKEPGRHALGSVRHKISGPAPAARIARFVSGAGFDYVHGSAASAQYDAVHERRVLRVDGAYWLVHDWLHGAGAHRFDLRFHLDEQAAGQTQLTRDAATLRVTSPALLLAVAGDGGIEAAIDAGYVSYRYGEKFAVPVPRFTRHGRRAAFASVLWPGTGSWPAVRLHDLAPITTDAPGAVHAWRIDIGAGDGGGAGAYVDTVVFGAADRACDLAAAGLSFRGDFLFLRRAADGRVLAVHHSPGAELRLQ